MRYKRVAEHVQARAAEGDKKSKKMAKAIDEDDLKDHDSKAKAKHTAGKNSAAKGKGSNDKKAKARATASASASSNTALPVGYPIADGPNRPLLKQLSASYRDKKFLTADKHFSVADCEALAVAEVSLRIHNPYYSAAFTNVIIGSRPYRLLALHSSRVRSYDGSRRQRRDPQVQV